jgi:hypothetical protein
VVTGSPAFAGDDKKKSDIDKVDEPQLKAMFETSAEVLGGLIKAFHPVAANAVRTARKSYP